MSNYLTPHIITLKENRENEYPFELRSLANLPIGRAHLQHLCAVNF